MAAHSDSLIAEEVVGVAESIEALDDPYDDYMEPLEVKVIASLHDASLQEIKLVMTTGGPHIEVALFAKRVDGFWGGDEHSCHVNNDELLDTLADYYTDLWEANL